MPPRKRREQAADAPSGADQAPPSQSAPDVRPEAPSAPLDAPQDPPADEPERAPAAGAPVAAQGPDVRRTTRPGLRLRRGDRRDRFRTKSED